MIDVTTPIAIPTGWAACGSLRRGDTVLTTTGTATVQSSARIECATGFEVVLSDTGTARVGAGHPWILATGRRMNTTMLRQRLDALIANGHPRSLRLPNPPMLQMPHVDQPHDGYHVGERVGQRKDIALPVIYRRGDIAQRKAVLAGLMDAGGTYNPSRQRCSFITRIPQVADTVLELLATMGLTVQVSVEGDAVRLEWTPPFNPFTDGREVDERVTPSSQVRTVLAVRRVQMHSVVTIQTDGTGRLLAGPTLLPV